MDSLLVDLATGAREISESREHQERRRLWADFHALRVPRALVSYGMYAHVWARDIAGPDAFHHQTGLARAIEIQLRARIWKAENVADDEPVLPPLWLTAPHPPGADRLWGVALENVRTTPLGAYKPAPPIRQPEDLDGLHYPPYEEDAGAQRALKEEALELTGGILPVRFHTDELHFGPFEWAVRMRGMDNLLYDVYDNPAFVHRLMDFVTTGMERYHKAREAAGAVEAEASWGFHMYYDETPPGLEGSLKGCWAYVHAQSSASLSPAMYAEFVQPYNERIASMFRRVYYHGCEDLSAKCAVIAKLPNLRLFHVSPWTPMEPVLRELGGSVAYEVHAHPTNVLFANTPEETRRELRRLHSEASGSQHVLKLCDVETVDDRGEALKRWAAEAREAVG